LLGIFLTKIPISFERYLCSTQETYKHYLSINYSILQKLSIIVFEFRASVRGNVQAVPLSELRSPPIFTSFVPKDLKYPSCIREFHILYHMHLISWRILKQNFYIIRDYRNKYWICSLESKTRYWSCWSSSEGRYHNRKKIKKDRDFWGGAYYLSTTVRNLTDEPSIMHVTLCLRNVPRNMLGSYLPPNYH